MPREVNRVQGGIAARIAAALLAGGLVLAWIGHRIFYTQDDTRSVDKLITAESVMYVTTRGTMHAHPTPHTHAPSCNRSMAFIHQQKSAGSTLRTAMQKIAAAHGVEWESKVQRDGQCSCGSRGHAVWSYSDEAPRCDHCPTLPWLTMWREPWERMRSAYMYCATTGDSLCFMPDYQAKRAPCDFGRRWGNYQFAKLAALPFSWRPPCAQLPEPKLCERGRRLCGRSKKPKHKQKSSK